VVLFENYEHWSKRRREDIKEGSGSHKKQCRKTLIAYSDNWQLKRGQF
jgi:hypothetical protein